MIHIILILHFVHYKIYKEMDNLKRMAFFIFTSLFFTTFENKGLTTSLPPCNELSWAHSGVCRPAVGGLCQPPAPEIAVGLYGEIMRGSHEQEFGRPSLTQASGRRAAAQHLPKAVRSQGIPQPTSLKEHRVTFPKDANE